MGRHRVITEKWHNSQFVSHLKQVAELWARYVSSFEGVESLVAPSAISQGSLDWARREGREPDGCNMCRKRVLHMKINILARLQLFLNTFLHTFAFYSFSSILPLVTFKKWIMEVYSVDCWGFVTFSVSLLTTAGCFPFLSPTLPQNWTLENMND